MMKLMIYIIHKLLCSHIEYVTLMIIILVYGFAMPMTIGSRYAWITCDMVMCWK